MRKRLLTSLVAFVLLFSAIPVRPYTLMYTDASAVTQIKWATTAIPFAISTSMSSASNITAGSDVEGAVRRALKHWSDASGLQFSVTTSGTQNIAQDNINLISVTNSGVAFSDQNNPGRARVFFDPNTGRIQEGDIALNPASQFSTDGAANTFDLEATLTHEIGHILGLEHSAVIGATMQPQQGANNTVSQYSLTSRTLSEDDRSGIRAIYAPRSSAGTLSGTGTLTGTVTNGGGVQFGAHVWAESVETGKLFAGNISITSGAYRIENITAGQYRVIVEPLDGPVLGAQIPTGSTRSAYAGLLQNTPTFRTAEAGSVSVVANAISTFNVSVGGTQSLNPRFVGAPNGSSINYSTVPAPLTPGGAKTIYVFGDAVNQVPESGVSLTSPFLSVVPGSYTSGFAGGMPYVKFDVATTFSAPPGEYSIRLQSNAGEVAYVAGGLTVDLANSAPVVNPLDAVDFFVGQQYRDFLNREPDDAGFQFWRGTLTNYLNNCGTADTSQAAECRARAKASVSEAFFVSVEFQETGYLVYRLYKTAFLESSRPPRGLPRYAEFIRDTQTIGASVIVNQGNWREQLESNTTSFLANFVQRAEFTALHPVTMTGEGYVNALLTNAGLPTGGAEKQAALDAYGAGGIEGRARALRSIAGSSLLFRKEFNRAFVLLQYFGYLRRNPDDAPDNNFAGYDFWLQKLNAESGDTTNLQTIDALLAPTKRARMVEAFVVTGEYRRRFGPE